MLKHLILINQKILYNSVCHTPRDSDTLEEQK